MIADIEGRMIQGVEGFHAQEQVLVFGNLRALREAHIDIEGPEPENPCAAVRPGLPGAGLEKDKQSTDKAHILLDFKMAVGGAAGV